MIIGLTGMSGAGKSTVSKILGENGYTVIDCDTVARAVITRSPCIDEVREKFPEVFTEGEFDRNKARKLLFADWNKIQAYQRIVFPYVTYELLRQIKLSTVNCQLSTVLDAPTLYQSKVDDFCVQIIAVIASRERCIERIIDRDKISREDAVARLENQHSENFFREHANLLIENNGDIADLEKGVLKCQSKLNKIIKLQQKQNR
ncbi:MAG: dephospho-CoA kinase [Oscillospiraceae bacterium]|nr:dephospho-CoA kinase [Oscillospiraceae bacterium]